MKYVFFPRKPLFFLTVFTITGLSKPGETHRVRLRDVCRIAPRGLLGGLGGRHGHLGEVLHHGHHVQPGMANDLLSIQEDRMYIYIYIPLYIYIYTVYTSYIAWDGDFTKTNMVI